MKKLIHYSKYWLLFRIYYYLKFIRPANFVIKGKIRFDFFSLIILDNHSYFEVDEGLTIKKSVIHLKNSELRFGSGTKLNNIRLMLMDSTATIGDNCTLSDVLLSMTGKTDFLAGNYFLLKGTVFFKSGFFLAGSKSVLGENVNIRAHIVCSGAIFQVGNNVFINDGTQVRCEESITIGSNVFISYECIIFDSNTHSVDAANRNKEIEDGFPNDVKQSAEMKTSIKKAPILIGDEVWIGTRAIVFKGTSIGDQVIVGAGAVIAGLSVPHHSKVYGNPAIIK